jgi:hypothetical protein
MSSRDEKIVSALFGPFMAFGEGRGVGALTYGRAGYVALGCRRVRTGQLASGEYTMATRILSGAANDQLLC